MHAPRRRALRRYRTRRLRVPLSLSPSLSRSLRTHSLTLGVPSPRAHATSVPPRRPLRRGSYIIARARAEAAAAPAPCSCSTRAPRPPAYPSSRSRPAFILAPARLPAAAAAAAATPHPASLPCRRPQDKLADQVSDAVLDACLAGDPDRCVIADGLYGADSWHAAFGARPRRMLLPPGSPHTAAAQPPPQPPRRARAARLRARRRPRRAW